MPIVNRSKKSKAKQMELISTRLTGDGERLAKLDANDTGAKWSKLFPMGERFRRDFPDGKVSFTAEYFSTMLSNWERAGKPALAVDYFHRGPSFEEGANEDKVAAGWIEDLKLQDDGLYALIKWTDKAREHILADELRYLSPYFAHNAMDRTTGKLQGPTLAGAALLNDPFLQDLPAVAASENNSPRGSSGSSSRDDGDTVEHLKAICAALGIDSDGDADDVAKKAGSAISAMRAKLSDYEKNGAKMNADVSAKLSANEGALKLANEQISKLTTDLQTQRDAVTVKEIADVVAKLEAGHHIVAAAKEDVVAYAKATSAAKAWETFSKFQAVPKGETGTPGKPEVDVAPAEALKQLQAKADELVKAGTPRSQAFEMVQRQNTALALAASKLTFDPKANA